MHHRWQRLPNAALNIKAFGSPTAEHENELVIEVGDGELGANCADWGSIIELAVRVHPSALVAAILDLEKAVSHILVVHLHRLPVLTTVADVELLHLLVLTGFLHLDDLIRASLAEVDRSVAFGRCRF